MAKQFWLMKSEPSVYSIADLERDGRTFWDGVRNYQARNYMRDAMQVGDGVLFYHSSAEPAGVAGLARISAPAGPDLTALDRKDDHFDPKATATDPIWVRVEVQFVERFPEVVSLTELKETPALAGMLVLKRGQRLSIQPVSPEHFDLVCKLGRRRNVK